MSKNVLIEGYNPLCISKIRWYPEEDGSKKEPGFFSEFMEVIFGVEPKKVYSAPRVVLYDCNSTPVKTIICVSDGDAKNLHEDLEEQLNSFLSSLTI